MILVFKRKEEEKTESVSMTRSVKASDIKTMTFKNDPMFTCDINWFVKDQVPLPKMVELTLITVDEETEKQTKLHSMEIDLSPCIGCKNFKEFDVKFDLSTMKDKKK
jgi:hypothetical protein